MKYVNQKTYMDILNIVGEQEVMKYTEKYLITRIFQVFGINGNNFY